MSKDRHTPARDQRPGLTTKPLSEWTFAGVRRQVVKLPLFLGLVLILLSPFANMGGEQLGNGFLVLMVSLVIGAFFQLVDERGR
jgi:hypothetical protein